MLLFPTSSQTTWESTTQDFFQTAPSSFLMPKASQLSLSLTRATEFTFSLSFPFSLTATNSPVVFSLHVSSRSIHLCSHSFSSYLLNSGSVSGSIPRAKDAKSRWHRFSLKECICHCHSPGSGLYYLRPRLWLLLGLPVFSFLLPPKHVVSEISHCFYLVTLT